MSLTPARMFATPIGINVSSAKPIKPPSINPPPGVVKLRGRIKGKLRKAQKIAARLTKHEAAEGLARANQSSLAGQEDTDAALLAAIETEQEEKTAARMERLRLKAAIKEARKTARELAAAENEYAAIYDKRFVSDILERRAQDVEHAHRALQAASVALQAARIHTKPHVYAGYIPTQESGFALSALAGLEGHLDG